MIWTADAILIFMFIGLYLYVFKPAREWEPVLPQSRSTMNLGSYAKLVTALVTGIIGWAVLVVNSAPTDITASEWIVGATALATALGVFTVPNATSSD